MTASLTARRALGLSFDVSQHPHVVFMDDPARQRQPIEHRIEPQFVRGALDNLDPFVDRRHQLKAGQRGAEIADHVRRMNVRVGTHLLHRRNVVNDGEGGQTLVSLEVDGLPAGRSFGAHLHRDSCSSAFGGPHYQAPDPANPVPANADADHEVWLDFTTNAAGRGRALARVPFEVQPGARAVVIHQGEHTMAGGTAGQRLACIDVGI